MENLAPARQSAPNAGETVRRTPPSYPHPSSHPTGKTATKPQNGGRYPRDFHTGEGVRRGQQPPGRAEGALRAGEQPLGAARRRNSSLVQSWCTRG